MDTPYHDGELAVQHRAGAAEVASRSGRSIGAAIPPAAAVFLAERTFLVIGAVGGDERVWCSPVVGPAGFLRAMDEHALVVESLPRRGDPLRGLDGGAAVGAIAIDPATRRRMRLNGTVTREGDGLLLSFEQVYANCPKYLTARTPETAPDARTTGELAQTGRLTPEQVAGVRGADTLFVATVDAEAGADASHRGGSPGFVRVSDDGRRLNWPDYRGNAMFQTLGNLHRDPRAGVLVVDWEADATLQISGTARVDWDPERASRVPGAQRLVVLDVERVLERRGAGLGVWRFVDLSRVNPPAA